ncbi:MAG: hypothetical protein M1358_23200, partial [Chloroflexi bacterium]|nr:hypothetical protein [Chloroflexota bacterium]
LLIAVGMSVTPLATGGVAQATPASWNDPNFKLVWERTDKPVQNGMTARSWMWGPETVPGSPGTEPYADSPGGNRTVQYFDKSRMEVNDPSEDRSQLWFVTNGLLVREMVSGQIQVGNASFTNKGPSSEAVAGDPANANPNCPTYALFAPVASLNNNNPSTPKSGFVNQAMDKTGMISTWVNPSPSPDSSVVYTYFDGNLKHNIPNVFWDFMNQSGLVYWNGAWNTATVVNWVFAMGFPITEPYWTKAKVGGVEKDVLVQLFERRVLTYTPANPAGFQVEMGNVGQHYYRWRYQAPAAEQRIAFASDRSGSQQIWTMKTTGGDLKRLTDQGSNTWPSWSPDNSKIAFVSDRDGNFEIYVINADGTAQQRLTFDPKSDVEPSWGPDGSRIIWNKDGGIYSMAPNGGDVKQIPYGSGANASPIYSPGWDWLVWASDQGSAPDFEVWKQKVDGAVMTRLTYRTGSADYPSDWHGTKILFTAIVPKGGGVYTGQIWSMDDDGGNQQQLTGDGCYWGTYAPDGSRIVFEEAGEIYIMNADGSHQVNITNAPSFYDSRPSWSN